jgi:glycosyltransferase involved in cell wall biosynthesis
MLESFAVGTPVIAADLGAMGEMIQEGETGARFRLGDPDDLARVVEARFAQPETLAAMRRRTRAAYEARYTAAANYDMLTGIYAQVGKRGGIPQPAMTN